MPVIHYEIRKV